MLYDLLFRSPITDLVWKGARWPKMLASLSNLEERGHGHEQPGVSENQAT